MSQLLIVHNRLKAQAGVNRLTGHQRKAYDVILNQWQFPGRLHLYGSPGSGKTYLGWVVAERHGARFLVEPGQLGELTAIQPGQPIIIDNVNPDSYALRQLLATFDLHNLHKILVISHLPSTNILPVIALGSPVPEDLEQVRRNLRDVGYFSPALAQQTSFWAVVHSTLS